MTTLARGSRWHLWVALDPWSWFELWVAWDYHNYILSLTILTIQVGFEWVWIRSHPNLTKGARQAIWWRKPMA